MHILWDRDSRLISSKLGHVHRVRDKPRRFGRDRHLPQATLIRRFKTNPYPVLTESS